MPRVNISTKDYKKKVRERERERARRQAEAEPKKMEKSERGKKYLKGVPETKILSRPTGTDLSRDVDVTRMTPAEREAISLKHGEEGRKLKATQEQRERNIEITQIQEAREKERATPEEEVIKEAPLEEEIPEDEAQEYYIDEVTGEKTPLYTGGVTPLTADNLVDVVSLATPLGLLKGGGKALIKKGGLLGVSEASKQAGKKGLLKTISSKIGSKIGSVGAALILGQITLMAGLLVSPYISKRVTAEDRRIQKIDSGLSQIRETITAPIQLRASGVETGECLEMIDDMWEVVLSSEKLVKELELGSQEMKTNPEFTMPVNLRVSKLKKFLRLAERQILDMELSEENPTEEDLIVLMQNWEFLLKD